MPRNLSPAMLAQVAAPKLRPALFLVISFATETVYLWNGLGPKIAPGPPADPLATFPYGQTFIGLGWMGEIRAVPQVADVVAENITLLLSGIPSELLGDAINAVRQNSTATLWLASLDQNNNVVADPCQVFAGAMDVPTISEGAETSSISITCENPLIDLNRAPNRKFTDIDQQFDYPGDTGFFQVQLLQDYNFTWPAPISNNPGDTPPPDYLVLSPGGSEPIPLRVGATQVLTATVHATDGSTYSGEGGGSFYSSDPSIAEVNDSGLVTAISQGMCTITKRYVLDIYMTGAANTSSNVSASVTVIVTD